MYLVLKISISSIMYMFFYVTIYSDIMPRANILYQSFGYNNSWFEGGTAYCPDLSSIDGNPANLIYSAGKNQIGAEMLFIKQNTLSYDIFVSDGLSQLTKEAKIVMGAKVKYITLYNGMNAYRLTATLAEKRENWPFTLGMSFDYDNILEKYIKEGYSKEANYQLRLGSTFQLIYGNYALSAGITSAGYLNKLNTTANNKLGLSLLYMNIASINIDGLFKETTMYKSILSSHLLLNVFDILFAIEFDKANKLRNFSGGLFYNSYFTAGYSIKQNKLNNRFEHIISWSYAEGNSVNP